MQEITQKSTLKSTQKSTLAGEYSKKYSKMYWKKCIKKYYRRTEHKKVRQKLLKKDTKESASISEYSQRNVNLTEKCITNLEEAFIAKKHLHKSNVCRQLFHSEFLVFW